MKEASSNGDALAYEEEIRQLKLRVQELEDWNSPPLPEDSTHLHSLTERNRQLELDLQRLQTQQRNNQLALDRLDEYEETIAQLQDELRSTEKKPSQSDDRLSQLREELEAKDRQLSEVIRLDRSSGNDVCGFRREKIIGEK